METMWQLQLAAQTVLLAVLIVTHAGQRHPWFSRFVQVSLAVSLARLFAASVSYSAYAETYFATEAVSILVLLAVTWELLSSLFLKARGHGKFACTLTVSAVIFVAASLTIFHGPYGSLGLFRAIDSSASQVCVVALSFSIVTARFFRIPWRTRSLGIAVGFLCYLVPDAVIKAFFGVAGTSVQCTLNQFHMGFCLLAQIVWIAYSLRPTQQPVRISFQNIQCAYSLMGNQR